ncbi:TetR family transcriptional regulator [Actinomadura barringtoniae]|uniref:TetR family transcriptional regulator n=1 Tax=Actinomadura barringtoniae TaxID=1427535 RepID=A0A939PV42_9ACTN|nr:TetR family transcriptional regulator [Actinomadura barringtoniae]MBO2455356.1 TetR family transcriptional regulator [Actinomadura barringtoniae]
MALDAEQILAATEDVLRRHGPAKATVVDVARVLGVSHGSVYRHFPSKTALREAVTRRWLQRSEDELARITADEAAGGGVGAERVRGWLRALFLVKRAKALEEPELFETFRVLISEHSEVAVEHVEGMLARLRGLIEAGVASGDCAVADAGVAARAVFDATARFHHPAHVGEWELPGIEADLDAVCTLIVDGLRAR